MIRRRIYFPVALALLAVGLIVPATAGDWLPREEAIKNLASSYAFMVLCSTHGHAKIEPVSKLGEAYQSRMAADAYDAFRDQYQSSLTDKKIYSIANKRWVAFQINEQGCETVDRAAEMYLQRLAPAPLIN